jgi:hypothetical protein
VQFIRLAKEELNRKKAELERARRSAESGDGEPEEEEEEEEAQALGHLGDAEAG